MGKWLGELPASAARAVGRRALAPWCVVALTVAAAAACGGDETPSAEPPSSPSTASTAAVTASEPGLRPCSDDRHLVAVEIVGLLTVEDLEAVSPWIENGIEPMPRPGAPEVFQAYRERGYELLYITTIPPTALPGGSVEDLVTAWLTGNGFPVGDGTRVWVWDGIATPNGETWVSITDELLALSAEGVSVDGAYSESYDKAYAFAAGGVAPEQNYSLAPAAADAGQDATSAPTTLIPNDDLVAHAATVQQLPPVCQVA